MKESYSTSEVASFCHVTADTIRKWAEAGRITVFKTPGGHRRIRYEDLLRFLHGNRIPLPPALAEERIRVLVVEDDAPTASAIRRYLGGVSTVFEVEVARDAFEAGHLLATLRPRVVFLGIAISGLNGNAACRRIASDQQLAQTRVIAVAKEWTTGDTETYLGVGAVACLQKPFTPDDLRRVLAVAGIDEV